MEIFYVAQVLFMVPGYGSATALPVGKPHLYQTYEECKGEVDKVEPLADKIPYTDLNGGKIYYICVPVGVH